MKRTLTLALVSAVLAAALCSSAYATGSQAVANLIFSAKALQQYFQKTYGVNLSFREDLVNYWDLKVGQYVNIDTTLYAGNIYVFFGSGDNDVKDVDVAVYDSGGATVASDGKSDRNAVVIVDTRNRTTQRYNIRVKLYSAAGGSAFVGYFMAYVN